MAGPYTHTTDASPTSAQLLITNDSPLVAYFPFAIDTLDSPTNLSAAWNLFYNNTAATNPNELGQGPSYHATSLIGASFLIQWNGTAVDLLGRALGDASYYLTLDGALLTPTPVSNDGLLASLSDLSNTNHTIVLTYNTSSSAGDTLIQFDGAVVSYDPPASVSNSTVNSVLVDDTDIFFTGGWTLVGADTDTYDGAPLHVSQNSGDRAALSFTGSAVSVYGLVSSGSGAYTAILDGMPAPQSLLAPTSSQGVLSNSTSQNPLVTSTPATARNLTAASTFTNPDALLFFATGLDQTVTHTLVLENDASTTLGIRVGGVNVSAFGDVTASGGTSYLSEPSTSTSTPAGTIAAAVLASVLIVVIAAVALWYFFVYRPRRRACRRAATQQHFAQGRDPEAAEGVLDIASSHAGAGPGTRESGFAGVVLTGETGGNVDRSKESSLSSSKGYGIGLGLRRGLFGLWKGNGSSTTSSGSTRSAGPSQPRRSVLGPRASLAGALGFAEDSRRFSAGTLREDAPAYLYPKAPVRALESEKLAPGWRNPYEPPRRSQSGFGAFQSLGALYGPVTEWVGDEKEEKPKEEVGVKKAGEHEEKEELEWDDGDDTATLAEDLLATLSLQPRYSEARDVQPQAKDRKRGTKEEKLRHAYAHPGYSQQDAADGDEPRGQHPDRNVRRSLLPLPLRAHSPFRVDVGSFLRPSREKRGSDSTGSGSGRSTKDRQQGKGKAKAKPKSSLPSASIGRSFLDFSASIIGTSLHSPSGMSDPSVRRSKGASTGSEAGTRRKSEVRESHLTAATQDTHVTQGSDAEVAATVSSAHADNGHDSRSHTRSPNHNFNPPSRRQSFGAVLDISRDAIEAANSGRQGSENDEAGDAWTSSPLAEPERLVRTGSGRHDVAPVPDAPDSISPDTSPSHGSRSISGAASHTRSRNESGSGSSHPRTQRTRSSGSPFPFPVTRPSSSSYDHLNNAPQSVGDEAEDEILRYQPRDRPSPPPLPHPLRITVPTPASLSPQNAPTTPYSSELPEISPTSSVPFSVSDLQFRHSGSSWGPSPDSRRVSAVSGFSHMSRPGGRRMSNSAQAYIPPTPYIVQRVLGMTAPPAGPTHSRAPSQSNPQALSRSQSHSQSQSQSQPQPQSQPRTPMSPPYLGAHSRGNSVIALGPSRSTSLNASAALQPPAAAATPTPSPGFAPSSTTSSTFRIGSLLGPRPRPSRPPTAEGVLQQQQEQAEPQREGSRRGPR
ncbi:hypothetical protein CONPUDRAFT_81172 [Coniophora puteana RWD-64-598 SS2]|uniref:Uncharacterized protein n=1 Tax=Coniophora puteana (strain RWD-64-598) TaxID=741705 RepID=A0A5M3MVE4_CONPW|nr:uncharacterized protein CONPUDRAFT_81172 [Coniophora puteana RWD-64-598 SS2]EIW83096.1 hypothetical protein CONPUDRAFT_81172 [Coniophora puteana RWD-64-598 SS2]